MTLLEDLTTDALDRDGDNGWQRQQVTTIDEHRDTDLLKPFKHAYMTPTSLTIKDTKVRKVIGDKVSTGELSRLYLRRIMDNGAQAGNSVLAKRVPWRKAALQFLDRGPAYFFGGQCGGPFVLLDIKACYANLYTRLSLDMLYRPDCDPPLIGFGQATFPKSSEWMEAKGPRNALWGTVLSSHGPEWRHGQRVERAYPNSFFAPDMAGLVYDAIHAISAEARTRFGALSWAVDGGIFRPDDAHSFSQWLKETWGLTAEVRAEGPGWMFGATSYQIGGEVTLDVKKGKAREWPEMSQLREQEPKRRAWLASIFMDRSN
jgi:hypothetical protein